MNDFSFENILDAKKVYFCIATINFFVVRGLTMGETSPPFKKGSFDLGRQPLNMTDELATILNLLRENDPEKNAKKVYLLLNESLAAFIMNAPFRLHNNYGQFRFNNELLKCKIAQFKQEIGTQLNYLYAPIPIEEICDGLETPAQKRLARFIYSYMRKLDSKFINT